MSETANPFDRFDGYVPEGEVVTPGPRPGFIERFQNNYDQGFYSGTVSGAVQGAYDQREEKRQTAARFEAMPQWETPLEGLAALGGQLAGAASSFENYIPLTWGAKAVGWTGIKMPQVAARFFAGAIDAGTVNAAVDTAVQGIEIGQGQRLRQTENSRQRRTELVRDRRGERASRLLEVDVIRDVVERDERAGLDAHDHDAHRA